MITDRPSRTRGPAAIERCTAGALAQEILDRAAEAIARQGSFVAVFSGGSTPLPVYRALEDHAQLDGTPDWSRWTVLLSDERCLDDGHVDRNDAGLRVSLPSLAAAGRIVTIDLECGPQQAAETHAANLRAAGHIDLALLGLGADGHTAGLFPRPSVGEVDPSPLGRADELCMVVDDAPPPFPSRVTLSFVALEAAREAWFLIDAEDRDKDRAVAGLLREEDVVARHAFAASTRLIALGSDGAQGLGDAAP